MDLLFESHRLAGKLANELSKTFMPEADNADKHDRTLVAYSGHFQPFHRGHFLVYQTLVKKFGKDNVYITTTNQQDVAESPMSYEDKKTIATEMFGIEDSKFQEVKNPYVPVELLTKFSPSHTSFVTVVSVNDAHVLSKSKWFHRYVENQPLKHYNEAAYYLTIPELTTNVNGHQLSDTQVMQLLGSPDVSDKAKQYVFKDLYGKENSQILDLISKKSAEGAEDIGGDFDKTDASGQVNKSKPSATDASGQKNDTDDKDEKDKIPPMQRMITNPETGREIKVQSALKYPRWKPVYKKAERFLKDVGIDREDRVKEPEVNQRYKARAKNMKKEDLIIYLGQALSEQLHDIVKSEGATVTVPGLGEIYLKLDNFFSPGLKTESDPSNSTHPVAIFAGRFQPFHKGHYSVYQDLVNKFGKDNVYIASSNKTDPQTAPFNFNDKKEIITRLFDIDPSHVVQTLNPYQSQEIVSKFPKGTPVVWALSAKDAERLKGSKYFKPYSSNTPPTTGYEQGGYVYVAPEFEMDINGQNISGTAIRNVFSKGTPEEKQALFTKLYGKNDPQLFDLISNRIEHGPANNETSDNLKLYLDDTRPTPSGFDIRANTAQEAIDYLKSGKVGFISFDHDLGPEEAGTGDDVAKWIEREAHDNPKFKMPSWKIHSANPVGTKNIEQSMRSATRFANMNTTSTSQKTSTTKKNSAPIKRTTTLSKYLKDKIKNPDTDNDIQIGTALKYDPKHAVYIAAKKYLKSKGALSEGLLLEAAPQSHIQHPYDDPNLTFGELKNIIHQSLLGDLDATEKLDGQNLLFTVRNGKVLFARNTQHTKNYGENAMTADQYEEFFAGHGDKISKIFSTAARDVTNAVSKIPQNELLKTFENGKKFVLSELLSSDLPNTLPYGTNRIVLINIREYDPSTGNPTKDPIDPSAVDVLMSDIEKYSDPNAGTFKISGKTKLQFNNSHDAEYKQKEQEYFSLLDELEQDVGIDDTGTLGQYFAKQWNDLLDQTNMSWTDEERQGMIRRWVYGDKNFGLKNLISDPDKKDAFQQIEREHKQNLSNIISPIKTIILKAGIDAVNRATNIVSKNDGTKDRLEQTLKKALDAIRASGNSEYIEKAKSQLEQLQKLGKNAVVPAEGLVFKHNNKLYKLTGSFAPVNQIVGIYTYKIAPEKRTNSTEPSPTLSRMDKLTARTSSAEPSSNRTAIDPTLTVKNPETDNDILVKTALKYNKNHPAYKAAQKLINKESLSEGGNAVKTNSKIPNQYAHSTAEMAAAVLGLTGLERSLVGSTHKPLMGDLDVAMDKNAVKQLIGYDGTDKKEFFAKLKQYLDQKGLDVSIEPGFEQFSVAFPLVDQNGNEQSAVDDEGNSTGHPSKVQVDFMMGNLPFMKRILTNGSESKYSSTYRNILLGNIFANMIFDEGDGVKSKYQINTRNGLEKIEFTLDNNGGRVIRNKEFVSDNPDDIARVIFGDGATFADMDTFEKLNQKVLSPESPLKDKVLDIYSDFNHFMSTAKKGMPLPTELPKNIPVKQPKAKLVATKPKINKKAPISMDMLNKTIKNPETDNDILIKTALQYDKSHPAYKAALKAIGK